MRTILEYIRTILLSTEFIVLIIIGILAYFCPSFIGTIRSRLNLSSEIVKWFVLAPATCLGLTLKDCRNVLFPAKDKKEILQKWNQYWKLRVTINVAIIYAILFFLMALPAWIITTPDFQDVALILMFGAIIGASVNYISVYNAEITVNELFVRHTEENKKS